MNPKLRIAVICGGKSAEHEISLISARNILGSLNRDLYEAVLIGIDREGQWWLIDEPTFLNIEPDPKTIALPPSRRQIAVVPGAQGQPFVDLSTGELLSAIDAVFPILHGPMGEDGTVQGLLMHANLAYVGPDVISSAMSMDKEVAKRLLTHAGIPNSRFMTFYRHLRQQAQFDVVKRTLGSPVFVKPANMGSSVGISRASTEAEFQSAIDLAFRFDTKLIVEEAITGREIEIAVLGNEEPRASVPGEVVPNDGFYSYESKYIDEKGARLDMPAKGLDQQMVANLRDMAIQTFRVLGCEGMARVDFFLQPDGKLLINEVNTLPGFTPISMYPKLWELTGILPKELVHQLIQFAIERLQRTQGLDSKM